MEELPPSELLQPEPTNIIRIDGDLVKPFINLVKNHNTIPETLLFHPTIFSAFCGLMKIEITPEIKTIQNIFNGFREDPSNSDIVKVPKVLTYRFVGFRKTEEIDEAVKLAKVYGGKSPDDKSMGICVAFDKSWEYAEGWFHPVLENTGGVIFVYDKTKLVSLTWEEIEADGSTNYIAGYGVKPKEGLKLSDALIAVIRLEKTKN